TSVQVHTSVVREGKPKEVPAREVVPGDVALLAAGDLVPADGILLEAQDLHLDQALLTGEPFPVDKRVGESADPKAELADATNALFMGTSFAIALAVGLTPELLPMVVSVTLSRGAMRMAAKRVIVKRLAAIENLGSMDVLCTDKTGTLTEAKISLERHVDLAGKDSERTLMLAYLNSHFETGLKSPLDEAILAHKHPGARHWK